MYIPKIALTKVEIKDIVDAIHTIHGTKVKIILFGSRVLGTAQKYSDVDVAIDFEDNQQPLKSQIIKDLLDQKRFPYLIDIITLNNVSPEFKKVVEETGVVVG